MIAVLCVGVTAWLAFAQAAMGTTKPTLTLTPVCQDDFGPVWEVWPSGTGWLASTLLTLKATTGYYSAAPSISFTTTPTGEFFGFGFGTNGPLWGFTTVEAFIDTNNNQQLDPGELHDIARIDNPCGPPTLTKERCKNGGYKTLLFNSQGECVAFVQRGPVPKAGP